MTCQCHVPCASCPWRRSNPPDGSRIPNFSIDKMRNLARTVGDGDWFRPIFACHLSPEGQEFTCVGYVARHGWSNLAVRLQALEGQLNIIAIEDACADLDLWPDFHTMLTAYEHAQR